MNIPLTKKQVKDFKNNKTLRSLDNEFPNRSQRRQHLQKDRAIGNHKGNSLTVTKQHAFHRCIQYEIDGHGKIKTIIHYREKGGVK